VIQCRCTVAPVAVHEVTAASPCYYSPASRITSTYGGTFCNNTLPGAYPFYYRAKITCEYWTPGIPGVWTKHNYTVYGPIYAVNTGNWSWAYCSNHGAYQHGNSGSAGPDWVLHLCAAFDPPGYGTGSGGSSCAY
jgi:hypothetical protein